jgi:hypothetical protein
MMGALLRTIGDALNSRSRAPRVERPSVTISSVASWEEFGIRDHQLVLRSRRAMMPVMTIAMLRRRPAVAGSP